jgi:hypothetical protein
MRDCGTGTRVKEIEFEREIADLKKALPFSGTELYLGGYVGGRWA